MSREHTGSIHLGLVIHNHQPVGNFPWVFQQVYEESYLPMIEALEHYLNHHDQLLEQKELSEGDISDLVNDRDYLEAIKQDIEKYRDELAHTREPAHVDA